MTPLPETNRYHANHKLPFSVKQTVSVSQREIHGTHKYDHYSRLTPVPLRCRIYLSITSRDQLLSKYFVAKMAAWIFRRLFSLNF